MTPALEGKLRLYFASQGAHMVESGEKTMRSGETHIVARGQVGRAGATFLVFLTLGPDGTLWCMTPLASSTRSLGDVLRRELRKQRRLEQRTPPGETT